MSHPFCWIVIVWSDMFVSGPTKQACHTCKGIRLFLWTWSHDSLNFVHLSLCITMTFESLQNHWTNIRAVFLARICFPSFDMIGTCVFRIKTPVSYATAAHAMQLDTERRNGAHRHRIVGAGRYYSTRAVLNSCYFYTYNRFTNNSSCFCVYRPTDLTVSSSNKEKNLDRRQQAATWKNNWQLFVPIQHCSRKMDMDLTSSGPCRYPF